MALKKLAFSNIAETRFQHKDNHGESDEKEVDVEGALEVRQWKWTKLKLPWVFVVLKQKARYF